MLGAAIEAFASDKTDWRETETAEIVFRAGRMYTDRVYVSDETMQKMTEARGWNIRDLPDSWRGYNRSMNILYAGESTWPEIIKPDREPDRVEVSTFDPREYWSVPAAPFEPFSNIRVYYINASGQDFFIGIIPGPLFHIGDKWLLDNGIYLLGAADDWIHFYSIDTKAPVQGLDDTQNQYYLQYKVGASGGHMNEQDIIDFLASLP